MKTVLIWIAFVAALALPVGAFWALIWHAMSMHPGIGIGQAAWIALRPVGSVMVMMTGARLARAFMKRPK